MCRGSRSVGWSIHLYHAMPKRIERCLHRRFQRHWCDQLPDPRVSSYRATNLWSFWPSYPYPRRIRAPNRALACANPWSKCHQRGYLPRAFKRQYRNQRCRRSIWRSDPNRYKARQNSKPTHQCTDDVGRGFDRQRTVHHPAQQYHSCRYPRHLEYHLWNFIDEQPDFIFWLRNQCEQHHHYQ